MQFINKITGSIVEPTTEFVQDQMKKSEVFEEIKPKARKEEKKK